MIVKQVTSAPELRVTNLEEGVSENQKLLFY